MSGDRDGTSGAARGSWAQQVAELRDAAVRGEARAQLSRRSFLQLLGAGAALGSGACGGASREPILPYTRRPDEVIPGLPLLYATAMESAGYGLGLLVHSREGRPIKVEGNPEHPASLGATGAYEQASLLDLYDPSRARSVLRAGLPADWSAFAAEFGLALRSLRAGPAAQLPPPAPVPSPGLRVLLEPTASPLVRWLLERIAERRPGARVHFHAPLAACGAAEAARAAFGAELEPIYAFERAAVVLALDADFTHSMPGSVRYARDFAARRRAHTREARMNRLYAVQAVPTPTGDLADHRLEQPASSHGAVLAAVLRELAALADAPEALRSALGTEVPESVPLAWVRAVARDLRAHAGESIVICGERQPPPVQALALALNALLGNLGSTLQLIPRPLRDAANPDESLAALVEAMRAGEVETLLVLGGNPVYSAPADLEFAEAFAALPRSAYLGLHADETAERARWFVPQRHFLESWGDTRAFDGTAALVQPLIDPLYEGSSPAELLAGLASEGQRPLRELLRTLWEQPDAVRGPEPFVWERALRGGVIAGSAAQPVAALPRWEALAELAARAAREPQPQRGALELAFRADASVYDGRFANNVWLQELPDPITKQCWGNAAWLDPRTAAQLGVRSGEWLSIERAGRRLEIPALEVPGCAPGTLALHLGYGRRAGVEWAQSVGWNAYALWTSDAPALALDARVASLAARGEARPPHVFARTQHQFDLLDRDEAILHVRELFADELESHPPEPLPTLYPIEYSAPLQWAMAIDLGICSGCSACVIACQAENNVPVVGREGVLEGREMHWLRIDRYLANAPSRAPRAVSQPMLCQHCETAPCEYVCPVYATTHSQDGLNQMIYNRCIGTRFCSNNCPYKVRRFNWFDYNGAVPETRRMQFNPEVTVRARGVIEKCTFCVQRIRRAQIAAAVEGRALRDGEVQTACQQACPTRAITFGSQADPQSEVSQVLAAPQVFSALEHLGTRPRTRYLAALYNPNPQLAPEHLSAQRAGRGRPPAPRERE